MHELDFAPGPVCAQLVQYFADELRIQRRLEESRELRRRDRFPGNQQRGFENLLDFGDVGHRCCPYASNARLNGRSPLS